MDEEKKKKLKARKFKFSSVQEFLGLTDEEVRIIDRGIKEGLTTEEIFVILN